MDYKSEYEYLKQQLEDERWKQEQESERAYQRREEARREREREWQQEQSCANDWHDAFQKALPRLRKEADEELLLVEQDPTWDAYFPAQVEQHEYAFEVWQEEMSAIDVQIMGIKLAAEKRIAKLEQKARNKAAKRVDKKFKKSTNVAENLRDDSYQNLVDW